MLNKWKSALSIGATVSAVLFSNAVYAQVPAPPPPPGQDRVVQSLIQSLEEKNYDKYSSVLADNVKVYEEDRIVSKTKKDWVKKYKEKFSNPGVIYKINQVYYNANRALFIEYFNSVNSWGEGSVGHCCWSYDAVAYDIVDGKVTAIRRLKGGGMKLKPEN